MAVTAVSSKTKPLARKLLPLPCPLLQALERAVPHKDKQSDHGRARAGEPPYLLQMNQRRSWPFLGKTRGAAARHTFSNSSAVISVGSNAGSRAISAIDGFGAVAHLVRSVSSI